MCSPRPLSLCAALTLLLALVWAAALPARTPEPSESRFVKATAQFAREHVRTGDGSAVEIGAGGRFGYSVRKDALEEQEIVLTPIAENSSLADNGVVLLDVRAELAAAGLTEQTYEVGALRSVVAHPIRRPSGSSCVPSALR